MGIDAWMFLLIGPLIEAGVKPMWILIYTAALFVLLGCVGYAIWYWSEH